MFDYTCAWNVWINEHKLYEYMYMQCLTVGSNDIFNNIYTWNVCTHRHEMYVHMYTKCIYTCTF